VVDEIPAALELGHDLEDDEQPGQSRLRRRRPRDHLGAYEVLHGMEDRIHLLLLGHKEGGGLTGAGQEGSRGALDAVGYQAEETDDQAVECVDVTGRFDQGGLLHPRLLA
jgi:hypothetical protein